MKKLEKRAIICLTMAAVLFLGICVFTYRFVTKGSDWATFYVNQHIYSEGRLSIGTIYDVNGKLLARNKNGKVRYNKDESIRRATVHAVGDMDGNIATAARSAFKSRLVGYNLLTGTYSITGKGNELTLTIDADVCRAAYEALGGRDGLVGVYNYETGEIICMVSSPGFDPENPPQVAEDDTSGLYINKFLSANLIPGSIFKLVTSAAAIENLDDLDTWSYTCAGVNYINGEKITCTAAHGTVDFDRALAVSCNCAFAELAQRVGGTLMESYVEKLGLTAAYDIDGIKNSRGEFEFPHEAPLNLAWAGIGQYNDQLNPCSMLVYMGAIARNGISVEPRLIHSALSGPSETERMIKTSTAKKLQNMMKNNVTVSYGDGNFPGLDIYAKSGTAEVYGREPNAWFTGFIKNKNAPYAFIVCVENGGYGSSVAGPIANQVLQAAVNR
ncbi:penicillin-binding transpeptidase domain-containing protein [Ihubacter sp. mB4P-1]|uniref:penicillin-binding transpeptidase domain-containing protein n=1 Tax=Ihubacter sp. mB4P-1 TaxID=3242370 RepID=UPI00137A2545